MATRTPSSLSSLSRRMVASVSRMSTVSVTSMIRSVASRPDAPSASRTSSHQAVGLQLSHRDVHRDREPPTPPLPLLGLAARLVEHPPAHVDDEARLLEHRDEVGGGDDATRRVPPPEQCLDARHLHGLEVEHRLVHHEQLVARDRPAGPSRAPTGSGPPTASPARRPRSGPCRRLRPVQRDVRVAEQITG